MKGTCCYSFSLCNFPFGMIRHPHSLTRGNSHLVVVEVVLHGRGSMADPAGAHDLIQPFLPHGQSHPMSQHAMLYILIVPQVPLIRYRSTQC